MRILVYNIHRASDENSNNTFKEISNYVKDIKADVVCFQEVVYPQYKKFQMDFNMNGKFAMNVDKINMLYGICSFSKYKIIRHEHIFLTSDKEQRGLLNICLEVNKEIVNIINTHIGLSHKERVIQINEILDYINTLEGKVILCGDFNEKNINISRFNDASSITNNNHLYTFYKSKSRIDYIFLDKNIYIDKYEVDKVYYSDHYPIILDINGYK